MTRKGIPKEAPENVYEARAMIKKNPKQVQAEKDGKIPYEYLVLGVLEDDAYVHKHGGDKYGKRNWTIDEILASTYVGAMFRHYKAWSEGEDLDPDSGRPHLTHLRACCAVVMDAAKHGKLIDDRTFAETKEPAAELANEAKAEMEAIIGPFPGDLIGPLGQYVPGASRGGPTGSQWVVIETLGAPSEGNIRGYGTFSSKEDAQSYGVIVRNASARQNHCSVMRVNNVKNIRTSR